MADDQPLDFNVKRLPLVDDIAATNGRSGSFAAHGQHQHPAQLPSVPWSTMPSVRAESMALHASAILSVACSALSMFPTGQNRFKH